MVAAVRSAGVVCPVSCKLQNLSIKLFSGSVSEPLAPDPCVFPPQHSANPAFPPSPAYHDGEPSLPPYLFTQKLYIRHSSLSLLSL